MIINRALISAVILVSFAGGGTADGLQLRPQRVRVSSNVAVKLLLKRVNPVYSKELREQRVQGMVTLYARISKDGDVIDVKLISGQPALAQPAIDAVKQWKYKPYLLNGEPIEMETQVLVNFTLAGS